MRVRALLVGSFLAGAALHAPHPATAAEPSAPAEAAPDGKTAEARRHFRNGIELYKSANYAGALAEFETAYEAKPGPGSLQNVALCQKALFRYAEAADSLRFLLERHASELSDDEKTAARTARDELEGYVGSIVVRARPAHARVTLDGRALDAASLGVPLRMNVGDHALSADAPGFSRVTKSVRVVGGTRDVPVDLALVPVMGFLEVRASDPSAVVAIDGRPVGMGAWAGPVSPAEDHLVQVYRSGYEPFETHVTVDVGETKPVAGILGPRIEGAAGAPPDAGVLPSPPRAKPRLGWYSIAGVNLFGQGPAPLHFDTSGEGTSGGALSLNLRLGRRLFTTLGGEFLLDAGTLNVERACDQGKVENEAPPAECGSAQQINRNYQLGWFRLGPVVRLSTPGEHWRGGAGFGAGLVWHQLRVAAHAADEHRQGGKASGWDPFFLLEVGLAYYFNHLSIGFDLIAQVDGAESLEGTFDGAHQRAYGQSGNALPVLGIGLRAGYSQ